MTDAYLTLQDLKARGWTPGMIRALLDPYDHERWINKRGHRLPKPIKLYLGTRVVQIEATEAFGHARERAGAHQVVMLKAVQTRQVVNTRALARYEALSLPSTGASSRAGREGS
ncbi:hypothetical protein [Deinococcus sp. QL22]|uniref:hypothetical protein n=1 Tax=Deinococcus sp. QL22 TaxID=2939437 RepID=UPI002017F608|nr:hypothetical protein [Deinococcus sp. QL22]UQN09032.1 hypothetical protein M1R55_23530 [Deinococcus sp. QL22]